nr:hypothetical protein [Tanacetum cinerariifolium]
MVTYGSEYEIRSPGVDVVDNSDCSVMMSQHSLSGRFPTVAIFKEYQNAAMAVSVRCHSLTLVHGRGIDQPITISNTSHYVSKDVTI